MGYSLEGSLLEVCTCNILCPCWVGEDPDGDGTCDSVMAWHVDQGTVNGTSVSGRTVAVATHIPGNVLKGNWKVALFVDDKASDEQNQALLDVWTGKLGGPVADLGTLKIGSVADMEMEPYRGPTGAVTTLNESIFTTIPGAPAWVAKASKYVRKSSQYGLKDIDLQGHNAIQGSFRFAI
jgi:hypothetical protein